MAEDDVNGGGVFRAFPIIAGTVFLGGGTGPLGDDVDLCDVVTCAFKADRDADGCMDGTPRTDEDNNVWAPGLL